MAIEITVGADPEVFLMQKNVVIPACGLVGGTKKFPLRISDSTFVQEDNVTVEFNCAPVKYEEPDSLWLSATKSLGEVKDYLKQKNNDYAVHLSPNWAFEKLDDPAAWIFGCDPDFNAYESGAQNVMAEIQHTTRFAGGHVHFGYDKDKTNIPAYGLVVLCDMSLIVNRFLRPTGGTRQYWYGQAGRYRDKPYGFEYRTPSCEWLRPENRRVVADLCKTVHWALNNPDKALELHNAFTGEIGLNDKTTKSVPASVTILMNSFKSNSPLINKITDLYEKYVGL